MTEFVGKTAASGSTICAKHRILAFKYFCQVCDVLVCSECSVFDHFGHEFKEVSAVLDKKKAEVQSACSELEQASLTLSHGEGVLKDAINDVGV